jgi:YD repeat-containing protein
MTIDSDARQPVYASNMKKLSLLLVGGLILVTSPNKPRFIYDGKGQLVGRISPGAGKKEFVYDRKGQLQYKIDAPDKNKDNKKKR